LKKIIIIILFASILLNSFVSLNIVEGKSEIFNVKLNKDLVKSVNIKNVEKFEFEYIFEKPTVQKIILNGKTFDKITLSDLPSISRPNKPVIPIKPLSILLPQKTKIKNVEVFTSEKTLLGKGYNIELGKNPITININNDQLKRDVILYNENNLDNYPEIYPEEFFSNVNIQNFRGYSILKFNLHPVFYEKKDGKLYYYKKINLKINLEENEEINQLFRDIPKDKETLKETIENPQIIDTYSDKIHIQNPISTLVSPRDQYDYVIITSKNLKSAIGKYNFQSLIDYKIYKGLSATIVTIEEITSNSAYWDSNSIFNDTQAQIRNFIKDAYLNWNTEFILLGGDNDVIPSRELFFHYREMFIDIDELIPSDLYYSCLDGNYNSNENIIWGELADGNNGNDVDLIGEVYVGRAPVNSWEDVSNFVRKTLAYEQTQDNYLSEVLMLGEFLGSQVSFWGGDQKDIISGFIPNDYNIFKLYDRDWPGNNWPKSILINKINNNVHFINHAGHANYQYVMKMENSDIDQLTNKEYFFAYSMGCNAGGFDKDDCIGENFLTSPNGAFAVIMNSRYGWFYAGDINGPSQKFDAQFFKTVFNEGINKIGIANQKSKEKLISQIYNELILRYCYYELNLLGDPEISLKIPVSENHDVAVKNIDSSKYVIPNMSTSISAKIINCGNNVESNLNVKFFLDGDLLETKIISQLESKEEIILNFDFTPSVGVHQIKVEIPAISGENIIYNNFHEIGIIAGPDISINCLVPEPPFYTNEISEFNITINNLGVLDVQNINVFLLVDSNVVDSSSISFLEAGENYNLSFDWVPTESKWHDLSFYAQPTDNEIYISVSNNYYNNSIYSVDSFSTLYVDDDGGKDFKSIKQALYWACPEVTIYVYPGKYHGRILLDNKIDIVGSDRDSTIIYGYSFDYILKILEDQITIKGFTFMEADRGIRIVNANGCIIEDNAFLKIYQTKEVETWKDGAIVLLNTLSTVISNNYIFNTNNVNDNGIKIEKCTNCTIENNSIVYSGDGIYIYRSNNIHIHNNTIDGYRKFCSWGIRTDSNCYDNIFERNTIFSNAVAMVISGGHNNLIKENMIFYNRLRRCTHFTEGTGIYIEGESNSVFMDNLISINLKGIIVLSSNNLFYQNNMIKNDLNAKDDASNLWNNSKIGNYWSDYTGYDNDSNGIGDTPYIIPGNGNNQDNYPVIEPDIPPNTEPGKPDRPKGETNGKVGNSYTYETSVIDPDGGYVQFGWDWNGDVSLDEWSGIYLSGKTGKATHTWSEKGAYAIRVKARDIFGAESEWSNPLVVKMPKNKATSKSLLLRLLERFPILQKIMPLKIPAFQSIYSDQKLYTLT